MDALKYPFKNWLINTDKKAYTTANGYISGLKHIEEDYNERTGELFFFFDCKQGDILKIEGICKEDDTNGKYAFVGKDRAGAPISALKRYLVFLKTAAFTNPSFVLIKKGEKKDTWPFVSTELLKILFLRTVDTIFSGYEISHKAQDSEAVILESKTEKKVLVVLLESGIADFVTFGKLSAKLPSFMELFKKDGIEVEGVIIAGKINESLVQACKTNSKIKLKRFDLELVLSGIDQ